MQTRILILRHGQSTSNLNKTWAGSLDVELSELGKQQAEIAAKAMSSTEIDAVFSSDLKRAYDTALPFSNSRGLSVEKIHDLREWHGGNWEGVKYEDRAILFPEQYKAWTEAPSKLVLGESAAEVRERAGKALDDLAKRFEGKTLLVVSHGGLILTLPSYFMNNDNSVMDKTPLSTNCSLTEVIYENGKGRIARYSDDSYLNSFKSDAKTL